MSKQIVRYKLKFINGVGFQPYSDIARFNCEFEGGSYGTIDGFMIGYITGEESNILNAIKNCEDYKMYSITEKEALIFADLNSSFNVKNFDGKYIQPATIIDGKISQSFKDVPAENPNLNLTQYYKDIKIKELKLDQKNIQELGFICSNKIKLQIDDAALRNWTQLMATIMASSPVVVYINDFENSVHTLPTSEVTKMLSEVFTYIQKLLLETWNKKTLILAD